MTDSEEENKESEYNIFTIPPPVFQKKLFTSVYSKHLSAEDAYAVKVRERQIKWNVVDEFIDGDFVARLRDFESKTIEEQRTIILDFGPLFANAFVQCIHSVTARNIIEYLLTMLNDLMIEIPSFAYSFHELQNSEQLIELLRGKLHAKAVSSGEEKVPKKQRLYYCYNLLIKIIARILVAGEVNPDIAKQFTMDVIRMINDISSKHKIKAGIKTLMILLQKDKHRLLFFKNRGFERLAALLNAAGKKTDLQSIYQITFCIWSLSFNKRIVKKLNDFEIEGGRRKNQRTKRRTIIFVFAEILKSNAKTKEKIVRLILSTLVNLANIGNNNSDMVEADLLRILGSLSQRNWEKQLKSDLDTIYQIVHENLHVLRSWDKYVEEVTSGELTWGPIHKSSLFWRENIGKFEEKDFRLLRVLVSHLWNSDSTIQAIACHDLGEFAKIHPRGKDILSSLEAKGKIMSFLNHQDLKLQHEALFCIQKMLVSGWSSMK
ncbi:v-type proton atpase subunit h [Anaeramoeba flamelloides]|uniref:V-type proton atpase subunit h n=1 Tax=Anaeramoeba flamelloides TaxID=1746091 RepID=A0AAV7Z496_9EUKA|nr:v-type proton atpase subunit h [Anaeramoeba flamelloides]